MILTLFSWLGAWIVVCLILMVGAGILGAAVGAFSAPKHYKELPFRYILAAIIIFNVFCILWDKFHSK